MKKFINGKSYDTEVARYVDEWYNIPNTHDLTYISETLYCKRTGEYFLHGEGGAMTKYSQSIGQNQWSGGEMIIPLSYENAEKWVEEHSSAEVYEKEFGAPDEETEDHHLHVVIDGAHWAKLQKLCSESGSNVTKVLYSLIEKA